ncbi:hypothetical protein PsYK624_123750 [Phanerochaete sordida]|uniref:FAD-binding domain-containing protein n=1 Tax=Phanerochaete sordida TaxID=48140 RepID=A0A9P3GJ90_9APHY|nr:hypothetical protein PsYK624_123750 [Phanerochaete sordida]
MSTTASSNTDVLVVGAGPAGLTTALGLARAGIKVRIIDIKAQGVALGHADGVMPRTVEILQSYGVGDELLRKGHRAYCFSNYNYDPTTGGVKKWGLYAGSNTRELVFNAVRPSGPPYIQANITRNFYG